ncbi:30S ribosomal protein S1 [Longispora sp. K20-0274]|uniref:30S ribosomal protein S1 n=1 Tax=Longispora sp. K20-0274 TaxID=3088255 RepID=UPI00399A2B4A
MSDLNGIRIGAVLGGVVVQFDRDSAVLLLDALPSGPHGVIHGPDLSWGSRYVPEVGDRVTARVTEVDDRVRLARTAVVHADLWEFLAGLRSGQVLTGVVAAVESFGVFLALDEGPPHPVFPGVGFVTHPEASWCRDHDLRVGHQVAGEFLCFDTYNGEARISLRALTPDPLREFADRVAVGDRLTGTVTLLTPIGAFVQVAPDVEALLRPVPAAVLPGALVEVTVAEIDRVHRRVRVTAG